MATPRLLPTIIMSFVHVLCRLVLKLLWQFWQICTSSVLILLLAYWANGGLVILILVLSALFGLFYSFQDSLLYFPQQPESSTLYVTPASVLGLPYENIFVKTKDNVSINAVLLKQAVDCARVPTLLFLHGNAGNIGHRFINANAMYSLCGCNIMLMEYRGYGRSEGTPSESGLYKDAQAMLDYLHLRSDIDHSKIFIMGRSLGGAVAINLAARLTNQDRIRGLLVENTFTSIPEMSCCVLGLEILKWLPLVFFKNKYLSFVKIYNVQVATLFLSGSVDELVPPIMMSRLFQRCGARVKKLARFPNGTHNETWQCNGYFQTISAFLNDVTRQDINPLHHSSIYGVRDI